MAIIQSGESNTLLTIDPISNAGRVSIYDQYGNITSDINSLNNILNALNSNITIVLGGQATLGINVSSTSGTLTLNFEATIDNTNWFLISATPVSGGSIATSTTTNGQWIASTSGYYAVRTRISSFTSGSMTVSIIVTQSQSKIGSQSVILSSGVQITDGVNGTVSVKPASTAAIATDEALVVAISPNNSVAVTAASLPLPSGAATETTLSSRLADSTFTTRINTLGQKTAANSTPVILASDQSSIPVSQNGTWTVQPGNTANTTPWLATISQGGNSATVSAGGALKIDGSAVTQPVSGTITANIGTSGSLALDATLTAGSQTTRITDGTNTSSVKAASTAAIATDKALVVAISPNNSVSVTGTFFQATQPVSGTITANAGTGTFAISAVSLPLPSGASTETTLSAISGKLPPALIGSRLDTNNGAWFGSTAPTVGSKTSANSIPVVVASDQGTIPISGSITANIGTSGSLALDTTLTGGSQTTRITDGANTASVKASSTAAVTTDQSLVVAISPNTSINGGVVSSANSSTAALTTGATFTGTSEPSLGYQSISIMVMPIGVSAPPGTLIVQQSSDGTNWDVQNSFSVTGGTASPTGEFDIIMPIVASNFRIVYINGATAQTSFRLQTIKWPIKVAHSDPAQKGIQSQTFNPVQSAKDTGRVVKTFIATATAGVTSEAMLTLTPLSAFVAGGTGTSFSVTAGKILRIQALIFSVRATAATAVSGIVRLRISASGAVTTSTAVAASAAAWESVAVVGNSSTTVVSFPDGLEISGTMQLGVSQLTTATSASLDISVMAYEY